ncbi:MAG: glycerophosphodiester phosphodiesterase, partial [Blastochloris sp.]|nr:glycerophosphodiester phosphodiesterase [Blastochloris sp.]
MLGVTTTADLSLVRSRGEEWRTLAFMPAAALWREFLDADVLRLWDGWLNRPLVEDIRSAGREIWVMSGNLGSYLPTGVFDPARVALYRELGVDGVLVNEVSRFRRVLARGGYPRLIAHRGLCPGLCREFASRFAAAKALGADEIELDVRGTADRHLVICHDRDLARIAGIPGSIDALGVEQLAAARLRGDMESVGLCTLEEVFRLLGQSIGYNIHIKEAGDDGWIVARTIRTIREYALQRIAYIAGDAEVLDYAMRMDPE